MQLVTHVHHGPGVLHIPFHVLPDEINLSHHASKRSVAVFFVIDATALLFGRDCSYKKGMRCGLAQM